MSAEETVKKARVPRRRKASEPAGPDAIAVRAYFLHLERPEAGPVDNWLAAERELAGTK